MSPVPAPVPSTPVPSPAPATASATASATATRSPVAPWLRHVGQDSLYLLAGFPVALVAFVVVVTGLSLGVGLLITFIGLPVAVVTLMVARGFANLERIQLPHVLGHPVPAARYRSSQGGLRGFLGNLIDGQMWLDAAHRIVIFPITVVTWSLTVAWWSAALGATTWPLWRWALPDTDNDSSLPELLGIDSWLGETMFMTGLGLFFLATLPFVLRGMALVQAKIGEQMLCNAQLAELRARVHTLDRQPGGGGRRRGAEPAPARARHPRRPAAAAGAADDGPRGRRAPAGDDDPDAAAPLVAEALTQSRRPSTSCGRSPAASPRRSWPTGDWARRWPRPPLGARSRSRSTSACRTASGLPRPSRTPPTSWSPRRWRTSPSTARPRCAP